MQNDPQENRQKLYEIADAQAATSPPLRLWKQATRTANSISINNADHGNTLLVDFSACATIRPVNEKT